MSSDLAPAARGLHLHAVQAWASKFTAEAMEAVNDALELWIQVLKADPLHFEGISETLELSARIVYEAGAAPPGNLERAALAYHEAVLAAIAPADRGRHAVGLIDMAVKMTVNGQDLEAAVALRTARSIVDTEGLPAEFASTAQAELAALDFLAAARGTDDRALVATYQKVQSTMRELIVARHDIPVGVKQVLAKVDLAHFKDTRQ